MQCSASRRHALSSRRQSIANCRSRDPMKSLQEMLEASSWVRALPADLRLRVETETTTRHCPVGSLVCRKGQPVEHWIGVIDGLVNLVATTARTSPLRNPASIARRSLGK